MNKQAGLWTRIVWFLVGAFDAYLGIRGAWQMILTVPNVSKGLVSTSGV